jgi:NADH-quinone oxidoreductase subunit C
MTRALSGKEVSAEISKHLPGAVLSCDDTSIVVANDRLQAVTDFLKTSSLDFDYLANLTSVDYSDYFEVVYHLVSLAHNHSIVLKTRCFDRDNPVVASVTGIWKGASFQEREVYDLMGIRFDSHPNLKRLFLWEGFPGHPLRRDYL